MKRQGPGEREKGKKQRKPQKDVRGIGGSAMVTCKAPGFETTTQVVNLGVL